MMYVQVFATIPQKQNFHNIVLNCPCIDCCVRTIKEISNNKTNDKQTSTIWLKGHGNEADFLEFLQKLVPHRSLTLPYQPFRFWLRNRGDIRNRKTTSRLGDSASRRLSDSVSQGVGFWMCKRKLWESESRRLPDSPSRGVANSTTQQVGESFFKIFHQITAV